MSLQPTTQNTFRLSTIKLLPKLCTVTLILSAITIPLNNNWNSMAIVAFCVLVLLQTNKQIWKERLKQDQLWKVTLFFFIWLSITWFWDESQMDFGKYIERYALFAFFPIILSGAPKFSQKEIKLLCAAFTIVVIALSIVCLYRAYNAYVVSGDYNVFFYHSLSEHVHLTAIYLSNYCVAAITWLFYFQFIDNPTPRNRTGEKKFNNTLQAAIVIAACLYLLFIVFLLSSRLLLVILLLELLFLILYAAFIRKKLAVGLIIISALIIITGTVLLSSDYIRERWTSVSLDTENTTTDSNAFAARAVMWETAFELIKERPLLGYGLTGYEPYTMEKYKEKSFIAAVEQKLNAHNQYLQTWLNAGVLGFTLFMLILGILLIVAIRKRNYLLFLLVFHYMLHSLVESTLQVHHQLVFFWFFLFLFYFNDRKEFKPAA